MTDLVYLYSQQDIPYLSPQILTSLSWLQDLNSPIRSSLGYQEIKVKSTGIKASGAHSRLVLRIDNGIGESNVGNFPQILIFCAKIFCMTNFLYDFCDPWVTLSLLLDFQVFENFLSILSLLISNLIPLWLEIYILNFSLQNVFRLVLWPWYGLSWWIFHVHLKLMYFCLLGVYYFMIIS